MLSYETSTKLATLLLAISKGEQEIELIRQNLCQLREFEPYAAFQRIQKSNTGFINASDIKAFLAENRIFYTENQCHIFIKSRDSDRDSQLSYAEFLKGLLSANNAQLRATATLRMNYKVSAGQMLPINVERVLAKLVNAEISFYLNHDLQKARLTQQRDFTYSLAFSTIDKYLSEFLDYDNITSFLKGQAMYPDKEDVVAILQRLSKNDEGLITYEDFSAEIEPLTDLARESTTSIALKEKRNFHQKSASVSFSLARPNQNTFASNESSPGIYDPEKYDAKNARLSQTVNSAAGSEKSEQEFSFTGPSQANQVAVVSKSAQKSEAPTGLSLSTAAFSSDKDVSKKLLFASSQKERAKEDNYRENEININFTRTLRQLLAFTRQVELAREQLALLPDFCVTAFFGTFNPEDRVFVNESQLEEGFKKYGVFPRREELKILFKRLDRDGDGMLRKPDFEDMLLPIEHEVASFAKTRDAFCKMQDRTKTVDQLFSSETKKALNKVLTLCLDNEGLGQSLKEGLNKNSTFNAREVFEQLDLDQDGYITPKELREALEKNDWYVTEDELRLLVKIFDSNKDHRISFVEFSQELSICKV